MGPRQQKQLTQEIVLDHGLSVTGACKLTGMCHSQYYYVRKKDDSAVIAALDQLSSNHPVYGFRKLYAYLPREGKPWNHKKVYRVYKLLNMNNKRRGKRRLPTREKQPLEQQISINQKSYAERLHRTVQPKLSQRNFGYLFIFQLARSKRTYSGMDEYNNRPHEGLGNLSPTELSKNIRHKQQINQLVT